MKNLIKKILKESEDEFEWERELISQLRYHEDKESKGYYNADNKRMGLWEFYNDNGELYAKGEFINGERTGPWEIYYYNGKLSLKGEYINNRRTGPWEYYHPNGKLYSKGEYINDQLSGPWEYYYDNGVFNKIIEY